MARSTGDERLFTAVFDAHRSAVYAYLLGKTGDPETARDLLQDTFLRVWRRLGEISELPDQRRAAWVFTVARNLVTDTYRSRATRAATVSALGRQLDVAAPAAERPDSRAETAQRWADVAAAVRALPEELRVVVTMSAVGELTSAQIGEVLGQPAGTIRYKLATARRQLGRTLGSPVPSTEEV